MPIANPTLGEMKLYVAKQIGRASADGTAILDLASEIQDEIHKAIAQYNRQPWALLEFRDMKFTTTAGQTWYSAVNMEDGNGDQSPSRTSVDIGTILSIHYIRPALSGFDYGMTRRPYEYFEDLLDGTSSQGGQATDYTLYAGALGIWPTPGEAYQVNLSGIVKSSYPDSDDDTSVWTEEYAELIELSATRRMWAKYLRNMQRAADYAAMEQDQVRAIENEYMLRASSGKLKAHG